ncbi:MAG: ABC transporter substrate-binding protein [Deltaproteobacteria bacterium]|nr:ABC transporter substrate-binding protein [Deltaproteobacteria bacterium]
MSFRKKQLTLLCLPLMVAFLLLTVFLALPGSSQAKDQPESWVFTKQFPKPPWWTWGKDYWPTEPVRGGYYRTASANYIGLMNPNHWPVQDWVAMQAFYERLIYSDGNYRPTVPWIVKSWEYTDPVTCVMKLRKGIQFTDGSYHNAAALKYQMEWIKDKKNGAWSRAWLSTVKSVDVVDEYTVRWNFKEPWGGFLGIIANVPGYPISAKALKGDVLLREAKSAVKKAKKLKKKAGKGEKQRLKYEKAQALADKLAEEAKGVKSVDVFPVGTGAYTLEEANPGNFLKVKRNPNWWFGKSIGKPDMPYYDGRITYVIPDPSVQLANLRAGKIESMGVSKAQYENIKDDPNFNVYVYPHNAVFGLTFNHQSEPIKDIRVRKAISHAIDRKALIQGTQFGMARIASCMYPEDHWTHNPDLKPVPYDPELSKRLLAEAGYPNGLKLRGNFGNEPISINIAEAVKAMLAQVGIDWKVDFLDAAAGTDRYRNLEFDVTGLYWNWIWDPDLMASAYYHPKGGWNYGKSTNERAIALIEAGRAETDVRKRQKIYFELEKVLYEDYEDVWIWWDTAITAYRKVVQGYNHNMMLQGREGYSLSHRTWFKDGHP